MPSRRSQSFERSSHLLETSLSQTFHALMRQDPEAVEQDQIRRAMELSLLDCALVIRKTPFISSSAALTDAASAASSNDATSLSRDNPYQILGLSERTPHLLTLSDVKAAYRKRARQTHPDRQGGNEAAFHRVARAYRSLLRDFQQQQHQQQSLSSVDDSLNSSSFSQSSTMRLKGTAHWDRELANHQKLVQELFAGSSDLLRERRTVQENLLRHALCLQPRNAGSTNYNETRDQILYNSCFYLSLAASYLAGIGALLEDEENETHREQQAQENQQRGIASTFGPEDRYLIGETALHLKRTIEAAVLKAHPEWALQGKIGDHVQAFSDFLVYLLDSDPLEGAFVSEWAVVVFDSTSGVADLYKGQHYNEDERPETAASHCLTLRYTPGHYEALLPRPMQPRPTLSQILKVLDANGIFYVVTDGSTPS